MEQNGPTIGVRLGRFSLTDGGLRKGSRLAGPVNSTLKKSYWIPPIPLTGPAPTWTLPQERASRSILFKVMGRPSNSVLIRSFSPFLYTTLVLDISLKLLTVGFLSDYPRRHRPSPSPVLSVQNLTNFSGRCLKRNRLLQEMKLAHRLFNYRKDRLYGNYSVS